MQFERHMSDNEALMWNLEKDPALSSWFASITLLDRRRRSRSSGPGSPSRWPRSPGCASGWCRASVGCRRRCGSPTRASTSTTTSAGSRSRRRAGPTTSTSWPSNLLLDPFERTRPLWLFVIIEGLADGRAALFQKMHHTITDGEGGIRLAEKFTDLEREASHPDPVIEVGEQPVGEDFGESAREAIGHNVRRVGGVAQRVVRSVVTNPVGTATGVGAVLGEVSKTLFPSSDPAEAVGSPLWKHRSLKRWFGTIQVPFDDAKAAAKRRGGTINDFFVAGALAGTVAYHEARDAAPNRLRVAMPISTRRGGTAGGNQFSITTTDLAAPTGVDAAFDVVLEGLAGAKSGKSVDILGSLSMIINLLPTSVIAKFAKDAAATVDFTVSNVRGAPFSVYIAGAKVDALFPMGPISGTAFNLTTMSYAGSLDMGLVVDAGAVEAPAELRDHIEAAYAALIA